MEPVLMEKNDILSFTDSIETRINPVRVEDDLVLSDSTINGYLRLLEDILSFSGEITTIGKWPNFIADRDSGLIFSDSIDWKIIKKDGVDEFKRISSTGLTFKDSVRYFNLNPLGFSKDAVLVEKLQEIEDFLRFYDRVNYHVCSVTGCNLKSARRRFVEHTGRYDLVKDTTMWLDNGADFFLIEGQKFLERLLEIGSIVKTKEYAVESGQLQVADYSLKTLFKVFWNGTELERKSYEDFFSIKTTLGTPSCYTVAVKKGSGISDRNEKTVIFKAVPSESGTLAIEGRFGQPFLTKESDTNYWTEHHCGLFIKAAMYQLESFYRNTRGQSDLFNSIELEVHGIQSDYIEEATDNPSFERD